MRRLVALIVAWFAIGGGAVAIDHARAAGSTSVAVLGAVHLLAGAAAAVALWGNAAWGRRMLAFFGITCALLPASLFSVTLPRMTAAAWLSSLAGGGLFLLLCLAATRLIRDTPSR